MTAEATSDGPVVTDSRLLHFHACPVCAHSWACVSRTCLEVREAPVSPLTGRPDPRLRLPDPCRPHQV